MEKFLYLSPRILSLLFVGFLSLFALDVFNEYQGWELVIAFFIHLIPSLVLLIGVIIAWRYSIVGTVIFFGFTAWYLWEAGFDRPWSWYAVIVGPALIVGCLYLADWLVRKKKT